MSDALSDALAAVTWTQPLTGFRWVQTRGGETIQRFALRATGNAANWHALVQLNNLAPPFLADEAEAAGTGAAVAGQAQLKVPAPAPAGTAVVGVEDVFGTDLALVDGQLQADPQGDLLTVDGMENLDRAIGDRLNTDPGELVWHPEYGCKVRRLIGQGATGTTDQLAAAFVAQAINADPRISSVPSVTASVQGDTIPVQASAVAVDGKRVPVSPTITAAGRGTA